MKHAKGAPAMRISSLRMISFSLPWIVAFVVLTGCSAPQASESAVASPAAAQEKGGQEEFGPYELVENWPQPLPDGPDGIKHDGWSGGSVGAVVSETPDRIWIAQRGELPLPAGEKRLTPYAQLNPPRGNATGNDDGLGATCEPTEKRGWERRYHHVIFVVDRNGKLVQSWP